eukprot:8681788-Alexandrium_andersonii.AAC.1
MAPRARCLRYRGGLRTKCSGDPQSKAGALLSRTREYCEPRSGFRHPPREPPHSRLGSPALQ